MSALGQFLHDWLMWLAGGLASLLAPLGATVKRNRDRSIQNQRQLRGDPSDPNAEGVLQIASDTRQKVEHLENRMDDQHRELKEILEEKT